ncbi:MAG: HAD family phosphatase [Clostridia bacterium]|nr:HAD family phosphatase [Clostridia bacterium]
MKITGAIFDMDGTLLNSMDYWAIVPTEYLLLKGITPKEDTNRYFLEVGMKEWHKYQEIPYSFEEMSKDIYTLMEKYYLKDVKLKDGALDMLKHLKSKGVKMCLATATDKFMVEKVLTRLGIKDYFLTIFTPKDVGKGKRFPLIYERALEFLGTDKETTYVFEDAYYAINTCYQNGFKVVGVYDKNVFAPENEIIAMCDIYLDRNAKYNFSIEC